MIVRRCAHCGKDYETFPSIRLLYCSRACSGAAKVRGEEAACPICGKAFRKQPSRPDHRYCSKSCARTGLNLTDANPSRHRDLSGANNPMFGHGLRGAANGMYGRRKERAPRWKGGRKERTDGYVVVVAPDDHPHPSEEKPGSGLKYILEHRLVMEGNLGRYLDPEEVVHHRDENPPNNRADNLRVFPSQAEHARHHKRPKG